MKMLLLLLRRFFGPKKVTLLVALPEECMHVDDVAVYVVPSYPHPVLFEWHRKGEKMVPIRWVNSRNELEAYAEEQYGHGNFYIDEERV